LEKELLKGDVCAVIFEAIQGVGGLDEPSEEFVYAMEQLCKKHNACLIADVVQAGFGRTGTFFAYQKYKINPHVVSMAKGMGNGFPIGGILVCPEIEASFGLLGTTFGGNHLACQASIAVLDVLEKERLQEKTKSLEMYFKTKAAQIPQIKKVKGRGLMLGIEFDFEVSELRKKLIYEYHIFTGGSSNKNLIRILPPLTVQENHFDSFFKALEKALK
jgi:acetylornithine aminotransferase